MFVVHENIYTNAKWSIGQGEMFWIADILWHKTRTYWNENADTLWLCGHIGTKTRTYCDIADTLERKRGHIVTLRTYWNDNADILWFRGYIGTITRTFCDFADILERKRGHIVTIKNTRIYWNNGHIGTPHMSRLLIKTLLLSVKMISNIYIIYNVRLIQ